MADCVGDGDRGAGDADVSDAEWSQRHRRIGVVEEVHVDAWDVGVHGDVAFRQARIDDPSVAGINQCLLLSCHPDAPDDATAELAGGGASIDDGAEVEDAQPARHPDLAGVGIDADLAELRLGRSPGAEQQITGDPSGEGRHVRLVRHLDVVAASSGEDVGVGVSAAAEVGAAVASLHSAQLARLQRRIGHPTNQSEDGLAKLGAGGQHTGSSARGLQGPNAPALGGRSESPYSTVTASRMPAGPCVVVTVRGVAG